MEYEPRVEELTVARLGVTIEAVTQRAARNRTVVTVRDRGFIDVFQRSTGQHMARYLIAQQVLWHRPKEDHAPEIPRDWLAEYTGPWPPFAPFAVEAP